MLAKEREIILYMYKSKKESVTMGREREKPELKYEKKKKNVKNCNIHNTYTRAYEIYFTSQ